MIAVNLRKQQALDADPRADPISRLILQQI